jgi:hypothetical protein
VISHFVAIRTLTERYEEGHISLFQFYDDLKVVLEDLGWIIGEPEGLVEDNDG